MSKKKSSRVNLKKGRNVEKKAKEKREKGSEGSFLMMEVGVAVMSLFSFFVWLSLYHFNSAAMKSYMNNTFFTGRAGYHIASSLSGMFGYAAFIFPLLLALLIFTFMKRRLFKHLLLNSILFASISPFMQLIGKDPLGWGITGGYLGKSILDRFLLLYLGNFGSCLFFLMVFAVYIIVTFKISLTDILKRRVEKASKIPDVLKGVCGDIKEKAKNTKLIDMEGYEDEFFEDPDDEEEIEEEEKAPKNRSERADAIEISIPKRENPEEVEMSIPEIEEVDEAEIKEKIKGEMELLESEKEVEPALEDLPEVEQEPVETPSDKKDIEVQTLERRQKKEKKVLRKLKDYKLPPLNMLKKDEAAQSSKEREERIKEIALLIERKLKQHKVDVSVVGATIGPVVTMYEVELGEGVRVGQVANMEQDLGIVVGGKRIRVVKRIPGKPYIGIEVPNEDRQMIRLRSILGSDEFSSQRDKGLPVAVGETVDGTSMATNLAKMPHLLVAGTTGSGKSVGVNTFIMSFLYNMTPEEVKFIMIDPKGNEFNIYEGIPHLLLPVVVDAKKAALALKWAVDEMENRFRTLAENMVRDINSYNEKVENVNKNLKNPEDGLKKMPYIVVVIDEFADLMTVAGKDVEIAVMRIAQKARAAGIHLIIATQRPTRDVITGTIKANLPVRIAFRVASGLDSRTILDTSGAEMLLGNGDMLFIPPGSSEPTRVHGAFISTEEIKAVIKFIKDQFPEGVALEENIVLSSDPSEFLESGNSVIDSDGIDDEEDPLKGDIVKYIRKTRKCSASMLQRKFKIGYNRAARMVEILEDEGFVGPADGAKPRAVLIPEEG